MKESNLNVWESFDKIDQIKLGSNVSETISVSDCKVLRLNDASGDGIMTIYQVFEGIFLMFNDFHLKKCESEFKAAKTVLSIDHCREGAIEQHYVEGKVFSLRPGQIKIDTRVHHKGHTVFPNCHFHGITIGFEEGLSQKSLDEFLPNLKIDLKALAKKYCPDDCAVTFLEDPNIQAFFYPLYHLKGQVDVNYLKIKVVEILIFLKNWEPEIYEDKKDYIFADQVAKIRAIHEYFVNNMDEQISQRDLALRFNISEASMKKDFKQIYGESMHAYMKSYRLQQAALMLKNSRELAISEIALRVGYISHSKFTAAFREQFGKTPQEYRAEN